MKFTIRNKVLASILGTILTSILIVVVMNSLIVINFSNESSDQVYDTMQQEELENLNRIAADKALLLNEYFRNVMTDITTAFNFATDLFNGRINVDVIQSYWADELFGNIPPGFNFDSDHFGFGAYSWDVSTIFLPFVDSQGEYNGISARDLQVINESSGLDLIFRTLHESNPNYIWLYMGFEENDLYRQMPYNDMTWAREGDAGEEYYLPTEQPWYTQAVGTNGLNIFLDKDPEIPEILFLTASMPVKYDNGTLVGVISIDLVLDAVETVVSGSTIMDNGYAYLIDNQGNLMIHPALLQDPNLFGSSITELEFSSLSASQESVLLSDIFTKETGQASILKNGEDWFLSYNRVGNFDFAVVVNVPKADVQRPAEAMNEKIGNILSSQLQLFAIVVIIISGIILGFATILSKKIVEPVNELTEVTRIIATGNLTRSLEGENMASKEVHLLYTTFRGLVTALRFGNQDYYAGDISRALENYNSALELFTTMKNEKGIGICYNNIANIHRARGDLKDANKMYVEAIKIAEKLLEHAAPDERPGLVLSLASRYNNIGLLYLAIEEFDLAEEFVNKAMDMDRQIDNARGFSTRYGNLGQIYLTQGKLDKAKEAFDDANDIAKSLKSERAIAYATMNYGMLERASGNQNAAIKQFLSASEMARDMDVRVVNTCLKNIQDIYEEQGKMDLANEIDGQLRKLSGSRKVKEVSFVLDYSGSMSGKKIRAAVRGIQDMFKNQVNPSDTVSLILFESQIRMVFNPMKKEGNEKQFLLGLDQLKYPMGATAMFDAIGLAFSEFISRPTQSEQWIIALTDGDDNSSYQYNPKQVIEMARRSVGVNLVIIGVGDLKQRKLLEAMCDASDRGKFIHVSSGVTEAISTAFEEVSAMLAEVEVEGFVPDE